LHLSSVGAKRFRDCGEAPNKRLKLTARVDCGMSLLSARRSLRSFR
jgi:hypothetical protein